MVDDAIHDPPPSGWYPDPEDASLLRRWDGRAWTDERVPASRGRRRLRAHGTAATTAQAAPHDGPPRGPVTPAGAGTSDGEVAANGEVASNGEVAPHSDVAHHRSLPHASDVGAPPPTTGDLDAELVRRQIEIDRLVEREHGLARAVEDRRAEIDHIAEREEDLVHRIGDARAELARLQELNADADEAERRLAELTAAEATTAQEVQRRRAELVDITREAEDARTRADAERADVLARTEAERAEAQARAEAEQAELDRLRAAVEQARQDLDARAAETDAVAQRLADVTHQYADLARLYENLRRQHEDLRRQHEDLRRQHEQLLHEHAEVSARHAEVIRSHDEVAGLLEARRAELAEAEAGVAAARAQLVDLGERIEVQELGLYDYRHPAEDSAALATQLAGLRQAIVETLRAGEAITANTGFKLGHSASKGQQVVAEVTALSLRAYNAEAENAVRTAGPGGIDGALTRLIRAREAIARHGSWLGVAITDRYHALRTQEIEMAGEYKIRRQREAAAAAAAAATGAPGAAGREYVPGAGGSGYGPDGGYVPGASGYAPGSDVGQAPGPAYGTPGWEPPSPSTPWSTNARFGRQ